MPLLTHEAEKPFVPPSTGLVMPSTTNGETVVNIVFGISAVLFSLLTLWQAHLLWKIFRRPSHLAHELDGTLCQPPGSAMTPY